MTTRKALFWDVAERDIPALLKHSPEWVIPRVFEYGTIAEIDEIIRYYGAETVTGVLQKTAMRPVTRAMAWIFLGVDPTGYYAS